MAELDILWPLIHWERRRDGGGDFRIRPLWRTVDEPATRTTIHEFLVPLGRAVSSPREFSARLYPLFRFREHESRGEPGSYDIDWWFALLFWGGSSKEGEDYFAFFPIAGTFRDFLTYDKIGFLLFPLFLWTVKNDLRGTHFLWPLIGWGSGPNRGRPSWFRILPFYAYSEDPGRRENHSLLWPLFHWGREALDTKDPASYFALFPLLGWRSSLRFLSWFFLWPVFRHGHLRPEAPLPVREGRPPRKARYTYWDAPWPIFRYLANDWDGKDLRQWWLMPFVASTRALGQESLVLLYPFLWRRKFENARSLRKDFWFVPFWRDVEIRDKKHEGRVYQNRRLWPLFASTRKPDGSRKFRTLAPFPYDGKYAIGIREAWDWAWTLAEVSEDGRGGRRERGFAHLWSARTWASGAYQCSIPFLFNYQRRADGRSTLRFLQLIPISWTSGPSNEDGGGGETGKRGNGG